MVMERAERDMIFIELPVIKRYMNDPISEIGIVTITIMVARHLPRKNSTTIPTIIKARKIV